MNKLQPASRLLQLRPLAGAKTIGQTLPRKTLWQSLLLACSALIFSSAAGNAQENPVLEVLLKTAPQSDGYPEYHLAEPTLPDKADKETHSKLLASLPSRKQSVEELMNARTVAPFVFRHAYTGNEGDDVRLHTVDVWFVARGKLDQVYSEEFAIQLFQENREASPPKVFTKEELLRRFIQEPMSNESFGFGRSTILEKVKVEAVSRLSISKTAESVTIAGMIEPRFNRDPEFPNRWLIDSNDSVGGQRESSGLYQHAGFYTKITTFQAAPDLLFVESHSVFEEPHAWFGGSASIKSKLPIVFQSTIRSFRRRLQTDSTDD